MGQSEVAPKETATVSQALSMRELLDEMGGWKEARRGELVEGVVMSVSPDALLVNIGGKSEGVIRLSELQTLNEEGRQALKVGSKLLAIVLEPESKHGHALLSYDRAAAEHGWTTLQQAMEQGTFLPGVITATNRGGAVVVIDGVQGFIPISQLAPETKGLFQLSENGDGMKVPRTVSVKVLELDRPRRRVVLSEKAAWLEATALRKRQVMGELKEGQVVKGRVTSLSSFGAFVDIGGLEGLLHVSEIAWQPVRAPEDAVKVGDELQLYVLKLDREVGRVSLSLRRMQPHPWDQVASRYEVGQVVQGTVTKLAPFGAFMRLEPGVEGLVHISELSSKPIEHPHQVVKEGDVCTAKIVKVDMERRRLGLSLRQVAQEEDAVVVAPVVGASQSLRNVLNTGVTDVKPV
ncbi:MAG: S1 RNA-binding domain-containing protein [Dehalococcoidia bacterium]|nr:S1 RNA-binding domain-containing protein [Dehalococcoidia bacterium]